MDVCMYVCIDVCMYACMHACMCVCLSVCLSVCLYVCMYVCLSVPVSRLCMCWSCCRDSLWSCWSCCRPLLLCWIRCEDEAVVIQPCFKILFFFVDDGRCQSNIGSSLQLPVVCTQANGPKAIVASMQDSHNPEVCIIIPIPMEQHLRYLVHFPWLA